MENINQTLQLVCQWVREVGQIHLSKFRSEMDIETKQNANDLVTEIDKQSEAYLVQQIENHFPTHSILGEESGHHRHGTEWLWVIDPVDGTNNYSQGLPFFTVSVALQHHGQTVLGVVYAAYLNELFTAVKGGGACLNGKAIKTGSKTDLSRCLVATGYPSDKQTNPDNNGDNTIQMLSKIGCLRRFGGAALDLCYVAAGFLDGYWELNIHLWDVAAGVLIVQEAGGTVEYLRQNGERGVCPVAANPVILQQMLNTLT